MIKMHVKGSGHFRKFLLKREDGSMTVLGLYIFMMMMLLGGLALDVANAIQARTQLQIAADAAGHAAILWRRDNDADAAIAKAIEIANGNMPTSIYGDVLAPEDIVFGTWDRDTRTFTEDATSKSAVWVSTRRLAEHQNGLSTYLLKIIGLTSFDINTDTVWETYRPTCLREGFVADDIVDVQSNNTYKGGFCIHSNKGVELNNGNTYEPNSIVSMPDWTTGLILPDNGWEQNTGLGDALRDGVYEFEVIDRITDYISQLQQPGSDFYRPYTTNSVPIIMNRTDTFNETTLTPGNIYAVDCPSESQKIQISSGTTLQGVVIITNCKVQFGSNVNLYDTVVATTSTRADSITGAADVSIGLDDNCATGGGSQIMTLGGISFPSQLNLFGAQMLAAGDIDFTANAYGTQGASVVAGGTISGTSNMTMGFCGDGMEGNFEVDYVRMVL